MSSDPCSFSSFTRCVTRHLNLSLHLDFDRHVIRAKVELTVEALEDRFSTLVILTEPGTPGVLTRYNCVLALKLTARWHSGTATKNCDNLHGVWCKTVNLTSSVGFVNSPELHLWNAQFNRNLKIYSDNAGPVICKYYEMKVHNSSWNSLDKSWF